MALLNPGLAERFDELGLRQAPHDFNGTSQLEKNSDGFLFIVAREKIYDEKQKSSELFFAHDLSKSIAAE